MKNSIYLLIFVLSGIFFGGCLKEDENPAAGAPAAWTGIPAVRSVYKAGDVRLSPQALGGAHQTSGVVISEYAGNNLPPGFVVIQNNWRNQIRGLILQVGTALAPSFAKGDSLLIDLNGATLTRIDGALAITNLSPTQISKVSSSNPVIVQTVAISNLQRWPDRYESTLVAVTADVEPFPQTGETFAGTKKITDGPDHMLDVVTDPGAAFANEHIAPSASFQGILFMGGGNTPQLRLQKLEDMMDPSGPVYPGYPEDFEFPFDGKQNYNVTGEHQYDNEDQTVVIDNNVDLRTGNWKFEQSLLGNLANDRVVSGRQAVRFQQNLSVPSYLQMNYDVPNGATKVTFWYGSYGNDVSCSFDLEYSTDEGRTWHKIGETISDAHPRSQSASAKLATYTMDIQGPVRFRIHKLGLGPSSGTAVRNGRLGVDDFAIYQNY